MVIYNCPNRQSCGNLSLWKSGKNLFPRKDINHKKRIGLKVLEVGLIGNSATFGWWKSCICNLYIGIGPRRCPLWWLYYYYCCNIFRFFNHQTLKCCLHFKTFVVILVLNLFSALGASSLLMIYIMHNLGDESGIDSLYWTGLELIKILMIYSNKVRRNAFHFQDFSFSLAVLFLFH